MRTLRSSSVVIAQKKSHSPTHHHFLDLANRLGRIETLGADIDAVHDGMAAEQAIGIFKIVKPLAGGLVAGIRDEAVGGEESCRANELVRIPPE